LFRRREPLHERLAREGGLYTANAPPPPATLAWGEAGVHGFSRPRQWDVVTLAEAEGGSAAALDFVALPDGTLLVEDDVPSPVIDQLAAAIEAKLRPPYRAEAVRRGEGRFAVAARAIEVAEVREEVAGDELELIVNEGGAELRVDGEHVFGSVPSLTAIADRRFSSYVLRAERLDGPYWEVHLAPL
jgi:hypothetical protein